MMHGDPRRTHRAGALGPRSVQIAWTTDDDRLRLTWTETGGPAVAPPTRRSFGTRMMESLGQQLNGQVELDFKPAGFVYALNVPLGVMRTPTRSLVHAETIASTTSKRRRARFTVEPPYSSLRRFVALLRN